MVLLSLLVAAVGKATDSNNRQLYCESYIYPPFKNFKGFTKYLPDPTPPYEL